MPIKPVAGHSIARSTAVISSGTMLSRVTGLIRDMLIADYYLNAVSDAFFVAFRLPNMLREMLAEGAMNAGFIPVFSEYMTRRSSKETEELVAVSIGAMGALLMAVSALGVLFAPEIVRFVTFEFGPPDEKLLLAIGLTRVVFPFILLVGIASLLMAMLNSLQIFFSTAYAPVLLNLGMIACAYLFRNNFKDPVYGLAVGVLIGGVLQILLQIPFIRRCGIPLRVAWNLKHPGLRMIFVLLVPTFFGQAVREVNVLADTMFAWYLGEGMVSALYYAYRLLHLPLAVFGLSVATAILPSMSRSSSAGEMDKFKETLSLGLRTVMFTMLPATVGLIILRVPIIRLLFEHGSFDALATDNTAFALMFYSLGLYAFSGAKVLAFAFYSMKNTRLPVIVAACSMILNILLNALLMIPLKQGGLALASSLSSTVNVVVLWIFLEKKVGDFGRRMIMAATAKIAGLSLAMGACVYALALICDHLVDPATMAGKIVCVLIPLSGGVIFYMGLASAMQFDEASQIMRIWSARRKKK
ncbi:murein biosynthesis integral membrane protein MurJ [Candidatus Poribacteria bacterium]|nr:murein biosynthesis integral membrane protein MurJ [Candidatus Poribacteria bacterium]